MIRVYRSEYQDNKFYAMMGRYFASLDIAKELERQLYNKDNSVWYVSTYRDKVLGFAAVFDSKNHYFLDNLYVLPDHRGASVASEIVAYIVGDFTDKPIKCVANNPGALKIFERHNFVEVGMNGKYKKLIKR